MSKLLANKEEKLWHTRIEKSLEWRKKYSCESNWQTIDNYYRHKFDDTELMPRFNLIYMMGQTLMPALVFQNPGILNTPANYDYVFLASIWDSIDSWWVRHAEIRDISKELVLSSYLHNTTMAQIGYDFDTESDQARNIEREMFSDVEGSVNRSRGRNAPWVDFIPSHRGIVAVGTRTMRNCPWAGKLVSIPTRALKEVKGLKFVQQTSIPQEIYRMEQSTWENKEKDKWTHFWEIHDAETGKWFWLGTHGKFILPPQEDPLQVFGLPTEVLSFNKTSDSIYGTPDAEYIRSQQVEGDEVRMHSMFMRRFSLPKFAYNSNVFEPKDIEAMMSSVVSPAIAAKLGESGDDDIRRHLFPFTPPTSLLMHREYGKDLLNDAQLINGFGPNQMGTFAPGRRTKYETQVVESTNSARLAYRRSDVANVIQGLTHRANILMSQNWSGETVQQVVGVDGAIYWVKAGMEQLKGIKEGLVTEVNVESLAPVSRERRKAEAAQLLAQLGNMQNAGMNTLPLIKQLLSTYEWVDINRVLPQMTGEWELQGWMEQQQKLLQQQGGAGQQAAQNLQGVTSLGNGLPSENIGDQYGSGNDMPDNTNV